MNNTKQTAYNKNMTEDNSSCRFHPGDRVLFPNELTGKVKPMTIKNIHWDKEFGGWVCACENSPIFIHEQNFILESDADKWNPHFDNLWSWWERR